MRATNISPEIDVHCHILPGVDDGPSQLDTSLAMASIAARDGTRIIIATPHTDGIGVTRDSVNTAVNTLNQQLSRMHIPIRIIPGFEIPYHLSSELAATHPLGPSNYVLIEFPHSFVPGDAAATLRNLITAGLQPVIAHPERNMEILENPDRLNDLLDAGVMTQVTAASITGELGPDIQQCSHYLLQTNKTHFVATDSHSPTFRKPVLSNAFKMVARLIGQAEADMIFIHNPASIFLSGPDINTLARG